MSRAIPAPVPEQETVELLSHANGGGRRQWRQPLNHWTEVCSSAGHPSEAMPWIRDIRLAHSFGDLQTSQSITRRIYPHFETLDAKIATAFERILHSSNFKKKIPGRESLNSNFFEDGRRHEKKLTLRGQKRPNRDRCTSQSKRQWRHTTWRSKERGLQSADRQKKMFQRRLMQCQIRHG